MKMGFASVVCYENGSKGLDAMMAAPVDIVFSDVQMPIMTGPEVRSHSLSVRCALFCGICVYVHLIYPPPFVTDGYAVSPVGARAARCPAASVAVAVSGENHLPRRTLTAQAVRGDPFH